MTQITVIYYYIRSSHLDRKFQLAGIEYQIYIRLKEFQLRNDQESTIFAEEEPTLTYKYYGNNNLVDLVDSHSGNPTWAVLKVLVGEVVVRSNSPKFLFIRWMTISSKSS